MTDFIVSMFAMVLRWLVSNVWLVVYWILIPLACGYGAYSLVKHGGYHQNLRFVAGAAVFVIAAFLAMDYSGEFGFVF